MSQQRKFYRQVHRVDANQPGILNYVKAFGVAARSLSMVGNGFPDALLALQAGHSVNVLVEIKKKEPKTAKARKAKALRDSQQDFFDTWPGPAVRVETGEQALKAVLAYSVAVHPDWIPLARRILKSWDAVPAAEIEQLAHAMRGYLAPEGAPAPATDVVSW